MSITVQAHLRFLTSAVLVGGILAFAPAVYAQAARPAVSGAHVKADKAPAAALSAKQADAPPSDPAVGTTPATASAEGAVASARQSAIAATLVLKVSSPTETVAELRQYIATLGGFPSLITNTALVLKLPPEHLSAALTRIGKAGLVMQKSLTREDLSLEIAKLEGQLESKRAILAELRRFFDTSDVAATLAIEKNMTSLVVELESVKGRLRVLRERAQWVVLHVRFQFKPRDRITRVASPFEWLNTVDLDRFLTEFQ